MAQIINGIDLVIKYLNEYKIRFGPFDMIADACISPEKKEIVLRGGESIEEKIVDVIHELIHLHPVYLMYLNRKIPHPGDENLRYPFRYPERQIEKLAQKTYDTRPDIIERIRKAIEEEKRLEKDKKI